MRFYAPQDGPDPRTLAEDGVEVWVVIDEGGFFVSNLGNVKDSKQRTVPQHNWGDYLAVSLAGIGHRRVHRLVFHAFEGGDGCTVFHTGDRKDNRLCNLERRATRGRLTRQEQNAVRARLREGIRPSVVAREFGLTTSHVNYYKKN